MSGISGRKSDNGKVQLRIKRKVETDEWKITWHEGGKFDEGKCCYESTKEDAQDSMKAMIEHYNEHHPGSSELERCTQIIVLLQACENPETLRKIQLIARSIHKELMVKRMRDLKVGDKIQVQDEFQTRKPYGAILTVTKVNITKVKAVLGNVVWNLPMSMLQMAPKEEDTGATP